MKSSDIGTAVSEIWLEIAAVLMTNFPKYEKPVVKSSQISTTYIFYIDDIPERQTETILSILIVCLICFSISSYS